MTNVSSIFGIIEELHFPAAAFDQRNPIFFEHEIIILWRRTIPSAIDVEALEYDLVIELVDPDGVPIQQFLNKLIMQPGKERMRSRMLFNAIQGLTRPGTYIYKLQYKSTNEEVFANSWEIPILIDDVVPAV